MGGGCNLAHDHLQVRLYSTKFECWTVMDVKVAEVQPFWFMKDIFPWQTVFLSVNYVAYIKSVAIACLETFQNLPFTQIYPNLPKSTNLTCFETVWVFFSFCYHSFRDQWVPWIKFLNLSVFTSKVKLWYFLILITQMHALKTWSYKYMTLRRIWYKSCCGKIHNFSVPSVTAIKIWCSSFWLTYN